VKRAVFGLNAVAAHAEVPVVEVDGRVARPGISRILSPSPSRLVALNLTAAGVFPIVFGPIALHWVDVTIAVFGDFTQLVYSSTSSARARIDRGMLMSSVFAVSRFTTSSKVEGCWTGRSAAFSPLKILSIYVAERRKLHGMQAP
jgi:hypothetical protein